MELTEVVHPTFTDRAPFNFTRRALAKVTEVDMKDAGRIELGEAIGKGAFAGFGGVVGIPGETEVVVVDMFEQAGEYILIIVDQVT